MGVARSRGTDSTSGNNGTSWTTPSTQANICVTSGYPWGLAVTASSIEKRATLRGPPDILRIPPDMPRQDKRP